VQVGVSILPEGQPFPILGEALSSVNGNFFFGTSMPGNMFADSYDSGVEAYNGAGSVTGTIDTIVSNGPLGTQTFTDTYTIAMRGQGTMTTSTFIFYVISPSKIRAHGWRGQREYRHDHSWREIAIVHGVEAWQNRSKMAGRSP
jgi:hypothetical protein